MANRIHATALIDPSAVLGQHVEIGPFCVVEAGASVGDGCQLAARAIVKSQTTLGNDNQIGEGALLGSVAPSVSALEDLVPREPGGRLKIGSRNQIRENVTIQRGLAGDTVLGDDNMLMVSTHIGHDCRVGSRCTLVNHVLLGAFAEVDDGACLGGAATVDERCRVGRLAMIGAVTKLTQDVPPYVLVTDCLVVGLNRVGLLRNGFSAADLLSLKAAYKVIYRQGLRWEEVLAILKSDFAHGPADEFNRFFAAGTRGYVQERRLPRNSALKFVSPQEDG